MSECTCKGKVLIKGENTPKYSNHLHDCPLLKKFLFYYEEGVEAWVPVPELSDGILEAECLEVGEEREISFKVFQMTEEELNSLPED